MKLTKQKLKEIIKEEIKNLSEAISGSDRKIMMMIVRDILENFKKAGAKKPSNAVGRGVLSVLRAMTYTPDNANYKNYKKYFSKTFNSKLTQKKLKQFHSQTDKVQLTMVKQAMNKVLGEGKLTEAKFKEIPIDLSDFDKVKKLLKLKPNHIVKHPFAKKTFGVKVDPKQYDKVIELLIKKRIDVHEGKLTEAKEPLWTKETVKDAIKQIQKGLKNAVPYLDDIGTGFGGESIVGKISLDPKKEWPRGYIENSRWALIHFFPDGTLDTIRMNGYSSYETRKKVPILRKSKNKSLKQAIDRMGRYFTVVRTKHPDK